MPRTCGLHAVLSGLPLDHARGVPPATIASSSSPWMCRYEADGMVHAAERLLEGMNGRPDHLQPEVRGGVGGLRGVWCEARFFCSLCSSYVASIKKDHGVVYRMP